MPPFIEIDDEIIVDTRSIEYVKKFDFIFMNVISANLNLMIKAGEKASKALIRDFGEVENLQVSAKGPSDFVTNGYSCRKNYNKNCVKNYSILSEEAGFKK